MVVLPEPCLFAASPILLFRWTLYALLAAPHAPIIQRMGCVYRDKPMFLTVAAALFAATVWTVVCISFFPFFANFATLSVKPRRPSNQAMQLTAGRRTERLKDEL